MALQLLLFLLFAFHLFLVRKDKYPFSFISMYSIVALNKRADKQLRFYVRLRPSIRGVLERLKEDPRRACDAHQLHGHLEDKWGCWLGSNIRMIYEINDKTKEIIVVSVGTHALYG